MKNLQSIVLYALFFVCLLASCRKNSETTPANIPITGTWVGTQTEAGGSTSTTISFTIKADNSLDLFVDGRLVLGTGNWQLTDNAFSATYTYQNDPTATYVYTATYDSKTGNLSAGTWLIRGTTTRGTWTVIKQ